MSNTKLKQYSKNWKHWITERDLKTCEPCSTMHGKIFPLWDFLIQRPPLHLFCRWKIMPMQSFPAGTATKDGTAGADHWLKNYGQLPSNYITKDIAKAYGWIAAAGNLYDVLPGKIIGGDHYSNRNGHLPSDPERIWYEADINYASGHGGNARILYSTDGLIFVTYDHYKTFIEIV